MESRHWVYQGVSGLRQLLCRAFAERFRGVPGHPFEVGFDLTLREERLEQPLRWKRPRQVFVNSMSDLFHKEVPWSFVDRVFDVMERADWHIFQVLTKRSSLMRGYLRDRYGDSVVPSHIWCGVSVEDRAALVRVKHLQESPVALRFLSMEPLLDSVGEFDVLWHLLDHSGWRKRPWRSRHGRGVGLRDQGFVRMPMTFPSSSNSGVA